MLVFRGLSVICGLALAGCSFSATGLTQTGGDGSGETTDASSGGSTSGEPTSGGPSSPTAVTTDATATTALPTTADPSTGETTAVDPDTTAATRTSGPETTGEGTTGADATAGETSTGAGETTGETTGGAEESSTGCAQQVWYLDADEDEFGDADKTIMACAQPDGYVGNPDDCDDAAAKINPGVDEECNNGDDDCDGFVDEWSPKNKMCADCTVVTDDEVNPSRSYYFCATALAWGAAKSACESKQAYLVEDSDELEHNFLVANLNAIDAASGPWWTGGHRQMLELNYSWLDGGNIANNDPRWADPMLIAVDSSKCVKLLSPGVPKGGKWVDEACAGAEPYICEYEN